MDGRGTDRHHGQPLAVNIPHGCAPQRSSLPGRRVYDLEDSLHLVGRRRIAHKAVRPDRIPCPEPPAALGALPLMNSGLDSGPALLLGHRCLACHDSCVCCPRCQLHVERHRAFHLLYRPARSFVLRRSEDVYCAMQSVSGEAVCHPRAIGYLARYLSRNNDAGVSPVPMSGWRRRGEVCKPGYTRLLHCFL